ncbi:hypothetical protein WG901_23080 [Novosphingobium sp. PS1R-30]|uniref:Uncharacterized protein n=1 Tax=Novosphingobium anseongense TaxID=3133436 RepID=A0ABU8S2I7_9SPHN
MPKAFLEYLRQELSRLTAELDRARSHGAPRDEVARLEILRRLVDNQIEQWSRDLGEDRMAA